MSAPTDDADAFVAAFLRQRLDDLAQGVERPLDDYLQRFPGHAEAIRAAWASTTEPRGPATPSAEVPPIPALGDYRLVHRLGRGGQGDVWLAEDQRLGRPVAIKLLRSVVFASEDGLERFRREAQLAARLDHPGICPVLAVGEVGGLPYLVMRFVPGEPLADAIPSLLPAAGPDRHARLVRVARIVVAIAEALHAAHEAGVLHRDVKPQNVMLAANDQPVLLDFGLARWVGDDAVFTRTGETLGTPAYLAPELLAAEPERADRGVDVYGLGVLLFECLTGERPFEGPTLEALYRQILDGPEPDVRQRNRVVPRELAIVCATAMHRDRALRYRTASLFAADLRRWLDGVPILARPIGPFGHLLAWAKRRQALAAALLALFVALGAGLAIALQLGQRANHLLGEWERLADLRRLEELVHEADSELWPAVPRKLPAMQAWLLRAHELAARLPAHQEALLRLTKELAQATADSGSQWRHQQLQQLVLALERFVRQEPREPTIASVTARQARALALATPAAAESWRQCAARVLANPAYAGLALVPQLGLVPLGADPVSTLEEFADPNTGVVPERERDGRLVLADDAAVVFVLLPGGSFRMGAQAADPREPNHDPAANPFEQPPHLVTLAPFLLGKHELTQSQWNAVMPDNPSNYAAGEQVGPIPITGRHPVENVSWTMASRFVVRCGYELPTEAQWEYACRAGSSTPWSTGADIASLVGAANFADEGARAQMAEGWRFHPGLDDGYANHAPVGRFAANRFGLHDLHGNVQEWCREPAMPYTYPVAPGTGERHLPPDQQVADDDLGRLRQVRGGAFGSLAHLLRSARRFGASPGTQQASLGFRPARALRTD
ncbi:MAG: SUMF1/EgtB/PvdO family nonheme iron enzyme [Planctomycetes bacterium]|nr:SUMF1/EgtB/PvdO family nonheme iron enzyme [Planctomycetota bacterium]